MQCDQVVQGSLAREALTPLFPGILDRYVALERLVLQQLVSVSCEFASTWRPWAAVKKMCFPYSQQIQYF